MGLDGRGQEQWVREDETVTRHLEKEALNLGTVWIRGGNDETEREGWKLIPRS